MYVIGSFTSRWLLLVPLVLLKVIFVTARPSPDVEASESHGSPADSDRDSITKLGGSRYT